nr:hypothetical protein BaRGS_021958 [Batillaria attramentaria]
MDATPQVGNSVTEFTVLTFSCTGNVGLPAVFIHDRIQWYLGNIDNVLSNSTELRLADLNLTDTGVYTYHTYEKSRPRQEQEPHPYTDLQIRNTNFPIPTTTSNLHQQPSVSYVNTAAVDGSEYTEDISYKSVYNSFYKSIYYIYHDNDFQSNEHAKQFADTYKCTGYTEDISYKSVYNSFYKSFYHIYHDNDSYSSEHSKQFADSRKGTGQPTSSHENTPPIGMQILNDTGDTGSQTRQCDSGVFTQLEDPYDVIIMEDGPYANA